MLPKLKSNQKSGSVTFTHRVAIKIKGKDVK